MNNEHKLASKKKKTARRTETILLAEDDIIVRDMAQALLESFGYEVISAVDGVDAVNKFKQSRKKINLLLFDVVMPNKNGLLAYDEIRAIAPDIKVIFTSGYSAEAVLLKAQADDHIMSISKPYLPSNLMAMVRSMMEKEFS
jgi:CheY-like chemotaxis protein